MKNALSSLRALRDDLEVSGDNPAPLSQQTLAHRFGLQQYGQALGETAFNLSFPDYRVLRSALLCCQLFISIEQIQKNYVALAQHVEQGLKILHRCRARPALDAGNRLLPAALGDVPLIDVYILKLYLAPCRFADEAAHGSSSGAEKQDAGESPTSRSIAPNMRAELVKIAQFTLDFLAHVSKVDTVEDALSMSAEKDRLLTSLDLWMARFSKIWKRGSLDGPEPITVLFLRLFHPILKIILGAALDSSEDVFHALQVEVHALQQVAVLLTERLKSYSMSVGNGIK